MNREMELLTDLARLEWRAGRIDWYPSGLTDDGAQQFAFTVEIYRTSYQQKFHAPSLIEALSKAMDFARWYKVDSERKAVR